MSAALSRSSIAKRIVDGDLVISPILDPKQLGPSTVDLRMGTVAMMSRAGAQSHVDPEDHLPQANAPHAGAQLRQQKHERFDIPFSRSFLLHPGSLILVPTLEWVSLPADLQGVVTARSSWAREGLNIATATLVNPDIGESLPWSLRISAKSRFVSILDCGLLKSRSIRSCSKTKQRTLWDFRASSI